MTKGMNVVQAVNPFKGIKNAQVYGAGAYMLAGVHEVEIGEIKLTKSVQKAGNPDMLIVEVMIIESTNADMVPGSKRTWIVNFAHQPALGNIKQFVAAAYNCDQEDVDDALAASITDPSQPCRGKILKCQGTTILTKEKRQPFTKCEWFFVSNPE